MYRGPYKYKILLAGDANNRKIGKKFYNEKEVNFTDPLTDSALPKLYVISVANEIVYIGFTFQSIATRLNSGLKAKENNRAIGYKWKHIQEELELTVFVFQNLFGKGAEENKFVCQHLEAVESELVYLIRNKTGKWPRFQNDLQIHYESYKTAKEKALKIYNEIME
ncbi:hypothetical protein [Gelidibacter pelagius]|uniref:GIY-YIG domain-containing protein n=1 Tax=Gelidibacter pelagius TaxID=2819985 RepID=A0ABS3SRF9_9FLAO|nr:hypothetical protein [Gelidibacter pelagius]MBO3098289.1 hypothetical protein [Gelidibacter pelagius]